MRALHGGGGEGNLRVSGAGASGATANNAEDFTMTTATVTARDLFSFLDTHGRYTVADGTRYDEVTDGHGNSFFVLVGALDDDITPTDDDSDYADWCCDNRPSDAHEAELVTLSRERDEDVRDDVDAAIGRAADAWVEQGGERAIVAVDVDAIAKAENVRAVFVAKRAKALGVPVL